MSLLHCAKYTLVLGEHVAVALFSKGVELLRNRLLGAYAGQRLSMKNGQLYRPLKIINAQYSTDQNFLPHNVLVTFEAVLAPIEDCDINTFVKTCYPVVVEREFRRRIRIDHPIITHRLGSVNNLSHNLNFSSRVIEYRRDHYRMFIDVQKGNFYVQYKSPLDRILIFRPDTLTLEVMYSNKEGFMLINPIYVRDVNDSERLLGVASFWDGLDHYSIKTIYIQEDIEKTILYYRYSPIEHSVPYHYLFLEREFDSLNLDSLDLRTRDSNRDMQDQGESITIYNQMARCLDGRLPLLTWPEMGRMGSVPKHLAKSEYEGAPIAYRFPKLDGNCGTLRVYDKHFVLSVDGIASTSHPHLLPHGVVYSLRDFLFVVETDLYDINKKDYKPAAIIDIKTTAFNAEQRMDIIQTLRTKYSHVLAPYYIFFQGELLSADRMEDVNEEEEEENLEDNLKICVKKPLINGHIYEVLLDNVIPTQICKLCRHRKDKRIPNTRRTVKEITFQRRSREVQFS